MKTTFSMSQLSYLRERPCCLMNRAPSQSSTGGRRPLLATATDAHGTLLKSFSLHARPAAPEPVLSIHAAQSVRHVSRPSGSPAGVRRAPARVVHAAAAASSSNDDSEGAVVPPSSSFSSSSSAAPAAAAREAEHAAPGDQVSDQPPSAAGFSFACPICLQTQFRLAGMPTHSGELCCPRCRRSFPASPAFLDLTPTSGAQQRLYRQRGWGGTELFRSPLVSFAYERGWRQSFAWAGFPGVEAEYEQALSYLLPAGAGRVLVDMSCGSGLFARRFARSGRFSGVIAADFSEAMLQQTRAYCQQEEAGGGGGRSSTPLMLLRADVGRLPFPTGSVAALHAGAAIHCWPDPQGALAEISRVLAPGGVFVASTFLNAAAPLGAVLGDEAVRPLSQLDLTTGFGSLRAPYRWWEEGELRELCEAVGLGGWRRERRWRFIMFAASKPE